MDGTHKSIVAALRKVGCQVFDTSRVGGGFPDLVVRAPMYYDGVASEYNWRFARVFLMECKTPRGRLTEDQKRFIAAWPETVVVDSVSSALEVVGVQ